ncbi:hypothetical protein [Prevotella bivia]|uniref:hypothetical protein n=1 Tax=Prevotella bivia TaxID=28125 RepID=UPI000B0468FB|nr:hypothetical protein [Prevotella bivia]
MMKKKYETPELQVIATEGVEQLMGISMVHTPDPKPGGDPLAGPSSAKNGVMEEEDENK